MGIDFFKKMRIKKKLISEVKTDEVAKNSRSGNQ